MSKEGGSQEFFEVFKRPEEISRKEHAAAETKKKKTKEKTAPRQSDELKPSIEPGATAEASSNVEARETETNIKKEDQLPRITITLTQMQCVLMALLIFVSWAIMFVFGQMTANPRTGKGTHYRASRENAPNNSAVLSATVAPDGKRKYQPIAAGTRGRQRPFAVRVATYKPNSKYLARTIAMLTKRYPNYKVFTSTELTSKREEMTVVWIGSFANEQQAKSIRDELRRARDGTERPL